MASRRINADNLAEVISGILEEYGDDIRADVEEVTEKVAKAGVKAIRSEASAKFGNGRYAKGWTSTIEKGRYITGAVIHNRTDYQLAHLLEYGHALKRGGRTIGRVRAFPHIEQVEQQIIQSYETGIINAIK